MAVKMGLNNLQALVNSSLIPSGLPPSSSAKLPVILSNTTGEDPGKSIVGSTAATAIGALILGLVFLVGVPGNIFVIWSILARARKQSVTTLLILNLACADGSLMALMPFFIVYLVRQSWVFGMALCKILFYLCLANMYASILLITLMSLHRLVAVMWPKRVSVTAVRRSVLRLLVGLWILVLVASAPAIVFREQRGIKNTTGKKKYVCDSFHQFPSQVVLHYTSELLLGFLVPYPVIIGSYVCILRRIRQTQFRRHIRSEKLILAIVVTFCLFWLPYHIINVVQVASAMCPEGSKIKASLDMIWQKSRAVTSALAFISSCANPLLYVFAGKSYIRRDGLAFMARLFEGTALDSGTRKSRQNSQNSRGEKEGKEGNCVMLNDREPDSNTNSSFNGNTGKNGQ